MGDLDNDIPMFPVLNLCVCRGNIDSTSIVLPCLPRSYGTFGFGASAFVFEEDISFIIPQ